MKKYAKQIVEKDNVATCVADIIAGEEVFIKICGKENTYKVDSDIPFGHKIAVKKIKTGEFIYKYGEAIGKATQDIKVGDWVHVHNVVGTVHRGSQAPSGYYYNSSSYVSFQSRQVGSNGYQCRLCYL